LEVELAEDNKLVQAWYWLAATDDFPKATPP